MSAERSNDLNHSQVEAADKTKYSIIALLSRLGASKEKTTLESRKDLWSKYQEEIRKGTDVAEKYSGKSDQNLAMLTYIKGRIKSGETFNANTYEFSSSVDARQDLKDEIESGKTVDTAGKGTTSESKGAAEEKREAKQEAKQDAKNGVEAPKTRWDTMKESGEKRDEAYLKTIQKDLEIFEPRYETKADIISDLDRKATIDPQVFEQWAKSPDNANWIHINGAGRDEAYKRLSEMHLGLDDLKKMMKGNEVSFEDLAKTQGYKNFDDISARYGDYRVGTGEYISWGREYVHFAQLLEQQKKDGADPKEIARTEQHIAAAKSEIEHYRPTVEKERAGLEKLTTLMKSGKKLIDVLGSKERFFYNKQADLAESETLDPETQKTLSVVDGVFPRGSKGPAIEDSKRVMTMLEIGQNTFTKDTSYFERHSSYGAAYDDIESRVLDSGSSEKTRNNVVEKFNTYIELALIKAGKSSELSKYKVTPEMVKAGTLNEEVKSLIRVGYIVDLHNSYAIEKAQRLEISKEYSKNPQVAELLKQFKEQHSELTDAELRRMGRKIDSKLAAGIMIGASERDGKFAPAVGAMMSFDVGNGYSLSVGLTGIFDAESHEPIANILNVGASKKIEITKDTKITFSLGVSGMPGLGVGASAVVETPISETTDVVFGAGVGVDALTLRVGAGGVLGLHKNVNRMLENDIQEKYKKAGISDIEGAKNTYEALLKHPVLGKQITETLAVVERDLKAKGQTLSEEYKKTITLEIYDNLRDDIENQAIADLDPGTITGGGVMISASILPIMPYITINLGKTTKVLRLVDATTTEISDEELKKQLDADLSKNPGAQFIDLGKSGRIVMDQEGRNDILMDQTTKFDVQEGNNLEQLNRAITKAKVRFEQTKDGILKMHIDNSRNANINVHLDPQLLNTQLIHDAKDFYLNFDLKQSLLITRKEVRYPFQKDGAYREISIYIKKDAVSENTLENTETAYLEKNIGKAIIESGIKSKIQKGENNLLDYQEFLKLQSEGKVDKFEIPNEKAYKDALEKLLKNPITREQLEGKQEKSRSNLQSLAEDFYTNGGKKHQALLKKITTEYNPNLEVDYKAVLNDFEDFLKEKKEKRLSPLERTFFRNILVELTFRDVTDRSPEARKKLLEHDKKWIKETLKTYLEKTSYKGQEEVLASAIMSHIEKTTFDKDEWKDVNPNTTGNLFVSMVGTEKIVGARRSNDYDGKRFRLINPKEFKVDSNDKEEAMVAHALLEIISPIDKSSPQAFLRSPLSLKLSKIIPFAFKPEDVDLYLDMMKGVNPNSDAAHAAFYEKYVALVEKVRDYEENSGEKTMNLGPEYGNVTMTFDVSTTVGLFEKCQNFTMMGKENLSFTIPNEHPIYGGASAETHARVGSQLQAKFRELGLAFGFFPTGIKERTVERPSEKPTKPETAPEVAPQVKVEVGDGVQNGQTQAAPQSGGTVDTTGF